MNSPLRADAQARRRLRRAAEMLVDDSSLRENLTDLQAKQLLDWGLRCAQEESIRTAALADDEALPLLEDAVAKVRRSMRLVSRIMGSASPSAANDLELPLISLLKNVSLLTGKNPTPFMMTQAETISLHRNSLDSAAVFQLLMAIVAPDDVTPADEEE